MPAILAAQNATNDAITPVDDMTTVAGVTSADTDDKNAAKISASVVCALVFVALFVTIICCRKRMHRSQRSSRSTCTNVDRDSDSDSDDDANFGDRKNMIELMRQKSTTSQASIELPVWSHVDRELKKTVKAYMIEYRCLSMGAVIGKGQFGMVHEALLTQEPSPSNDYGAMSHTKVAIKTLRGTVVCTHVSDTVFECHLSKLRLL